MKNHRTECYAPTFTTSDVHYRAIQDCDENQEPRSLHTACSEAFIRTPCTTLSYFYDYQEIYYIYMLASCITCASASIGLLYYKLSCHYRPILAMT